MIQALRAVGLGVMVGIGFCACANSERCEPFSTPHSHLVRGETLFEAAPDFDEETQGHHGELSRVRCWCLSATHADCILEEVYPTEEGEYCQAEVYLDDDLRSIDGSVGDVARRVTETVSEAFEVCAELYGDSGT